MAVVGFDVGNQSCYIATARGGGIETVANEYSDRATPAYVGYGAKQRLVGGSSKQAQMSNLKSTIVGFKRLIGRPFDDKIVQNEMSRNFYQITKRPDGGTNIKVRYLEEEINLAPEQVMATMLSKLKDVAEKGLQAKVIDCVITVPSFYTDRERRGMLDACQIAGLNCVRLMNETTAVALSYGIYKQDHPEDKPRWIVFVDMGHSSLQVSVCAFNKGKLQVKAVSCDPCLGGRDFDAVIFEHMAEDFKNRYHVDAKTRPRAAVRLMLESEKLKKLMSTNSTDLPMNIECFMDDKDVSGRMNRATFEQLAAPLLERVEKTMAAVLVNAAISVDDVEAVEIVGGSTRVPAVKQLVRKVFGKEPRTTLNADEAAARGCALQCAILCPTFRVRDFSITDCLPYPISLSWQGGFEEESNMEVFPRFHAVPFSKMLTFYRREPFELLAKYSDGNIPHSNETIGSFTISKVTPLPNGDSAKVKVKLRINIHGLLNVSSATMIEKVEEQNDANEEPMETDEAVNNEKKADKPETAEQTPKQETTETNGKESPMEEDQSPPSETEKEDKEQVGQPQENDVGDAEKKETKDAKKKKNKVKTIDLPIEASVPAFPKEQLNEFIDTELRMSAQDKLEKEKGDAKNAVEEYVYDMRDKLYSDLEKFISDQDREKFTGLLTSTEDWLYEEGEDQSKKVYTDKLAELQKYGEPVKKRHAESLARPFAFEDFAKSMVMIQKALDAYTEKDEKYNHIDAAEMEKVKKCLGEKRDWYEKNMNKQNQLHAYDDPVVLASQVTQAKKELETRCNPILSTPKPKVEPPKEEKKEEVKEETKEPSSNGATENEVKVEAEPMKDDKPEMDVD